MNSMALSFWFSLGFLLIGSGLVAWMYYKKKAGKGVLTMAAMATIALALMSLRMFYYSEKINDAILCVLVSAMDAIRYFAMGKSFDPSASWYSNGYYHAYSAMEISLSVIAPLFTATVLASVISMISDRIRLSWRSSGPVYFFSELNERSLTLAKDLRKAKPAAGEKKPKLVFCKVTGNTPLRPEAKDLGAVFIDEPIHMLKRPDAVSRQVRVFLIDDEEENNIQTFLKMQDWLCDPAAAKAKSRPESDFLVFSTQESAELVFSESLKLLDKRTLAYHLQLINETRQVTQQLLVDHPLYEAVHSGNKRISVLVVGCGYLGMQVVKTAMVCGMMDSYPFEIQVIDDQAERVKRQFFHENPFLEGYTNIFPCDPGEECPEYPDPENPGETKRVPPAIAPKFHTANVCDDRFDHVLQKYCSHSNYIVVATGDDQLNITTAQYLRRWYTRQVLCGNGSQNTEPLVFAAVRSPERYSGMKELEKSNRAGSGYCGKLYLFANNMEIYSAEHILHRRLDYAAAMLNHCYNTVKNAYEEREMVNWDAESRRSSKQQLLHLPVMTQRSNQLTALHSLYKLQDLLQWSKDNQLEPGETCHSLAECAKTDPEHTFFRLARLIDKRGYPLHDLEHRRWTLFHALNGWLLYPHDQLTKHLDARTTPIGPREKVHKNEAARLHGCMIPTNQLDEFSQSLAKYTKRNEDFQKNDRIMCLASLFTWLELSVDRQKAEALLLMLRTRLAEDQSATEMLDQIRAIGKKLEKAKSK